MPAIRAAMRRHRDVLVALGMPDTDPSVHGELIRLSAGYLDQGQAHATLPGRDHGFLRAVTELYARGASAPVDCRGAEIDMRRGLHGADAGPADHRADAARARRPGDDIEPYLLATALALPGWTGMFARLERHPEEHAGGPPASLAEFLAVRLLLERAAVSRACRQAGVAVAWMGLRAAVPAHAESPPRSSTPPCCGASPRSGVVARARGVAR